MTVKKSLDYGLRELCAELSKHKLVVFVDEFFSLAEPKNVSMRDSKSIYPEADSVWMTIKPKESGFERLLLRGFRSALFGITGCISCVTDTTSYISYYLPFISSESVIKNASATPVVVSVMYGFCTDAKPPTYDQAREYISRVLGKNEDDIQVRDMAFMCCGWWYTLGLIKPNQMDFGIIMSTVQSKILHGMGDDVSLKQFPSVEILACLVQSVVLGAKNGTPSHLYEEIVRFRSGNIKKMTLEKEGMDNIDVGFGITEVQYHDKGLLIGRRLCLIEIEYLFILWML
jgi:hypothetical protein